MAGMTLFAIRRTDPSSSMKNTGSQTLWSDAENPLRSTFNARCGLFGKNFSTPDPDNYFHYTIGFQFRVTPDGIMDDPDVLLDVGRQIKRKSWFIRAGVVYEAAVPWDEMPPVDKSNDDINNTDEDDTDAAPPKGPHVYSVDGPGLLNDGLVPEYVFRANFNEFVRVSFAGSTLGGDNDDGSRCSEKVKWRCFFWVIGNGSSYTEKPGAPNVVDESHGLLDPPPTP